MCNQNRGHDRSGIYVLHWNIWRTYCSLVDFRLRLVTTLAPVLSPTWLHPSRPYQPIPILGSWRDKGRYYSLEAAAVASLGSPVRTHFRLWWCRLTNHECTLCWAAMLLKTSRSGPGDSQRSTGRCGESVESLVEEHCWEARWHSHVDIRSSVSSPAHGRCAFGRCDEHATHVHTADDQSQYFLMAGRWWRLQVPTVPQYW